MDIMAKENLKQRHVEAFFKHLRALGADGDMTSPERAGVIVRAAAHSGILSIQEDTVADMAPAEVVETAGAVNKLLAEALEVPKN